MKINLGKLTIYFLAAVATATAAGTFLHPMLAIPIGFGGGFLAFEFSKLPRTPQPPPPEEEPSAWLVDGRVEQGLFFDKPSAENMASANCGTVVPLYRRKGGEGA